MKVVGVDGCKQGWGAIVLVDGAFSGAVIASTFVDVLAAVPDAEVVAVDIPIGLPDHGPRAADGAARKFLGPRRSSVFPVPPRTALAMPTYAEALAHCRTRGVPGLSRQAYALRDKILEVDASMVGADQVREVHPEVSFVALAEKLGRNRVLPSKKTWGGLTVRIGLLREVGIVLPDDIGPAGVAGIDDVVDAAVAAWTAERIARGEAKTLPAEPERDVRGRAVAIWY